MFLMVQTLALLQMMVLPGLILVRYFCLKGLIFKITAIFALSLLFNFEFIFLSASMHLYQRPVLMGLIISEIILIAIIYRHTFFRRVSFESWRISDDVSIRRKVLLVAAMLSIAVISIVSLWHAPSAFTHADTIFSWNRWALDWFYNQLPAGTWHYPQILPTNWSISYVLADDPQIQIFAHIMMSFFMLGIFATILDLARARPTYYWSIISTGMIVGVCMLKPRNFWFDTADVPVAFFAWLSICSILRARSVPEIYLGAIFAAGAALTKQSGLLILVLYPFFAYRLFLKNSSLSRSAIWKILFQLTALSFGLMAPWYIYKQIQIWKGLDASEVPVVLNAIYYAESYMDRLYYANAALKEAVRIPLFFYLGIFFVFWSVKDRIYRWVTLTIVIPYYFIWAFLFSYDKRNLVFSMPATGVAIGVGVYHFYKYLSRHSHIPFEAAVLDPGPAIKGPRWITVVVLFFIGVLALSPVLTRDLFLKRQASFQKKMGDPLLNQALYSYFEKTESKGKIITPYQVLGLLPGLNNYFQLQNFLKEEEVRVLLNTSEVNYLLVYDNIPAGVRKLIQDGIDAGTFREEFQQGSYHFIAKVQGVGVRPKKNLE